MGTCAWASLLVFVLSSALQVFPLGLLFAESGLLLSIAVKKAFQTNCEHSGEWALRGVWIMFLCAALPKVAKTRSNYKKSQTSVLKFVWIYGQIWKVAPVSEVDEDLCVGHGE